MEINIKRILQKKVNTPWERIYQGDRQGPGLLIFTTNFVEPFGSLTICLYEFNKNKDLKQKSLP